MGDTKPAGIFDTKPAVASPQHGGEPTLREMVRFYYGQHGQVDPDADTEAYFAALSTPSPDSGERMREALEPFAGVAVGEVWKHFSAENPTLRISSSDGSRHLTFVSAEWFERARAVLQESAR